MNNKITEIIIGKSSFYENDLTKIESTTLYNWGSYKFHVGNLLNDIESQTFVGLEGRNFTITSTIKLKNIRITKIYLSGRGSQCTKDFILEYLDNNTNTWIKFYTGTLKQSHTPKVVIDVPVNIIAQSIRLTSLNYYHLGPALSEFYFDYKLTIKEPEFKNSNIYKDSHSQEHFDFNKLLEG